MSKDDAAYLRHMLEHARKIQDLLGDADRAAFDADETLRVTVTHWLQVIGEAAQHVSEPFQLAHVEIPWRAMVGMRNRIVHDYLGIDDEIVWQTAAFRIPELITQLEELTLPSDEAD
jgi:uncharacterized protein with HEPN domain